MHSSPTRHPPATTPQTSATSHYTPVTNHDPLPNDTTNHHPTPHTQPHQLPLIHHRPTTHHQHYPCLCLVSTKLHCFFAAGRLAVQQHPPATRWHHEAHASPAAWEIRHTKTAALQGGADQPRGVPRQQLQLAAASLQMVRLHWEKVLHCMLQSRVSGRLRHVQALPNARLRRHLLRGLLSGPGKCVHTVWKPDKLWFQWDGWGAGFEWRGGDFEETRIFSDGCSVEAGGWGGLQVRSWAWLTVRLVKLTQRICFTTHRSWHNVVRMSGRESPWSRIKFRLKFLPQMLLPLLKRITMMMKKKLYLYKLPCTKVPRGTKVPFFIPIVWVVWTRTAGIAIVSYGILHEKKLRFEWKRRNDCKWFFSTWLIAALTLAIKPNEAQNSF